MELEFRELLLEDLPIIKQLSKSMDMRNDPKIGKTAETLIKDPKCFLYGAFEGEQFVGIGGLREKFRNFAWIEDIRVHGKHQKKGVGTALFKHGEQVARERGFPRVSYQTVTENRGSCRIGEKLGFERRHEMVALWMRTGKIKKIKGEFPQQQPLDSNEALKRLSSIPDGPKEEVCIGWSYIPFEPEFYDQRDDMNFYSTGDSVLLDFIDRSLATGEIDSARAIIYGSKEDVKEMLYGFIGRNKDIGVPLICMCPDKLVSTVLNLQLGFKIARVWTGGHNIVVFFDKKF